MILVIAYIINLFAPIVNVVGLLGLCGCIVYDDVYVLAIAGGLFVVGIIFGIAAYRLDIPPRWFWSKSRNDLFKFSVTAVLGYAWSFAMWSMAIYFVELIISKM